MDRATALTLLTNEYTELATDAKFTTQQTTTAYNTAIDMSLRQLGVQESDLPSYDVSQSNTLKYIALLNYYALKRFVRLLSIRFDVKAGSGAIDAARSQAFEQVKMLLDDAEQELLKLGIDLGGGPSFQVGRINLDFNEPGCVGEFDSWYWG